MRLLKRFLILSQFLLSPSILKSAGINVTRTIQRAGDAIITWPGCYHWGFNTGFNVAESSNFAIPEWIEAGRCATVCMCVPYSVRISMERFEALLSQFKEDSPDKDSGYTDWAKAKRRSLELKR